MISSTSTGSASISSASSALSQRLGRQLLRYGIVLFLLGLITGRLVQFLPLPRMGLSSHLQGLMNGTFLVVLGLVWPHLRLHARLLWTGFWLALLGTYLNWAVTLASAAWAAGGAPMPIAAGGHLGTPDQELILLIGLRALNVAMFGSCFLVLLGLRGTTPFTNDITVATQKEADSQSLLSNEDGEAFFPLADSHTVRQQSTSPAALKQTRA